MSKPSFQTVLNALCDTSTAFPNRYLPHFSDLTPMDISMLLSQWPTLATKRKRTLLAKLVELYQADTLLSFDALAIALLTDADEQIRSDALRLLVESDDTHILPRLMDMAENDPATDVRVHTIHVLGNYVELGELEEIAAEAQHSVENTLLRVAHSENTDVQRAAIEAIGFSSRPEADALIQNAYSKHTPQWVASALLAMGRSGNENWEELVLTKLSDPNDDVRLRAIQAAGELRIGSARQFLLDLLEEEEDDGLFIATIWALSQIGGEDVRVTIQTLLDQAEEDEIIDFLEEAIDNLDLTDQMNSFDLLALDPDDDLTEK